MSREMKDALVVNLASTDQKRKLMSFIGTLPAGLYDVLIKPHKKTRSLDQNAYYWVAVVEPFRSWIKEEWQESVSAKQAHEILKRQILGVKQSPSGIQIPPTSKNLSVQEFSEYVEGCARWLAEFCGIVVIPSELFYEGATESKPKGKTGGTVTNIRQTR